MQSSAAKADGAGVLTAPIVEAVQFLAQRGAWSIAWLDADLCVRERFGPLMNPLAVGTPVTATLDALLGLEDELKLLKARRQDEPMVLANVLPPGATSRGERMTISVYWVVAEQRYLLLISRAAPFDEIEVRLAAEVRARAIAEAEVAAQARIVQRVNQELAAANRDLEEFASVISHDLRAPLRGVRYAATDAKAALSSGNVEAASSGIGRALALSHRMSAMLTGLLDYARVGRKSDVAEQVRTGDLVTEIVESIAAGCQQNIVISGNWPLITTVVEPLDIVLRNLIENAVKHHDRADGCIIVDAEVDGQRLLLSISDDGPGIDPAWHEAIFLPFRQIADTEEVDGAGIGLALVKKTVERFGGSIEVQSNPSIGRGSTFKVEWPLILPA